MDTSKLQIGTVISEDVKPIDFYSTKLHLAQVYYTATGRELLSIVETLKELRNILLWQQIKVHTDHTNLTYKTFGTEQVMQWIFILKEYGHELIYIQGSKNVTPGALSRLDIVDTPNPIKNYIESINEYYGLEGEDISHPTDYQTIMQYQ